jgi:hypothetical protein
MEQVKQEQREEERQRIEELRKQQQSPEVAQHADK